MIVIAVDRVDLFQAEQGRWINPQRVSKTTPVVQYFFHASDLCFRLAVREKVMAVVHVWIEYKGWNDGRLAMLPIKR